MSLRGAQRRTFVVAGGGIGGLTAALALQAQGFHAIVLEQTDRPATQGAGIQISPNALHILDRLGVGSRVRESASIPDRITINDARSGKLINHFDLGDDFRKRYGLPYLVLHRADLLQALLAECDRGSDIQIRTDMQVQDCAQHANGITVLAQTKGRMEEIPAAALIGADGARSATRKTMRRFSSPDPTDYVAWRALLPLERVNPEIDCRNTGLWLAPNAHLVHYPLRHNRYMNIVCILKQKKNGPLKHGWMMRETNQPPLDIPDNWAAPLRDLLNNSMNWGGWPLYATQKVRHVHDGKVALVGDAAHAMLPFAAQGGASAIEDAAVLAHCCALHPDSFETAFEAYSAARLARMNKICSLARSNGSIYHLPAPLSHARNLAMYRMSQAQLHKRMDWLYAWREPQ